MSTPKKLVPKIHLDRHSLENAVQPEEPETPISDSAIEHDWPIFVDAVHSRLIDGKHIYGDVSFSHPISKLSREVEAELLDIMGWGFILWHRLRELQRLLIGKTFEE